MCPHPTPADGGFNKLTSVLYLKTCKKKCKFELSGPIASLEDLLNMSTL
jgi:hypothetical protein